MKRYLTIERFISTTTGGVVECEHSTVYKTLKEASEAQIEYMTDSDYVFAGFRIVELQEVFDV